jgi:hypothetical protein
MLDRLGLTQAVDFGGCGVVAGPAITDIKHAQL